MKNFFNVYFDSAVQKMIRYCELQKFVLSSIPLMPRRRGSRRKSCLLWHNWQSFLCRSCSVMSKNSKSANWFSRGGSGGPYLPHALANKLAQRALERIMQSDISTILVERGPERLLKSFSRRIGFLHYCEAAQRIVREWLAEDGLLGRVEEVVATEDCYAGLRRTCGP